MSFTCFFDRSRFRQAVLAPILLTALGAQDTPGADTTLVVQDASDAAEATQRTWTWLAGQVGWSDAGALRRRLPNVSASDIAWLQVAMDTDRLFLEQTGVTADAMLAEPSYQITRYVMAEVSATGMAAATGDTAAFERLALVAGAEGLAELQALDSALWDEHGKYLGEDARHLREEAGAGTTMFLWVQYAARIDQDALERLRVSAHDLVQMADYQLARKLTADAHVQSLVECVRCATPSAPYYDEDQCRAHDGHDCALSAHYDPAAFCPTYLSRVVHPAAQLARCPGVVEDSTASPD